MSRELDVKLLQHDLVTIHDIHTLLRGLVLQQLAIERIITVIVNVIVPVNVVDSRRLWVFISQSNYCSELIPRILFSVCLQRTLRYV